MKKQNLVSSWDTQHNDPRWLTAGGLYVVVVAKGYGFYSLCILMTKSTPGTQRQLLAEI